MIELAGRFVPLKINVGKDRETAKKFKVRGLPTIYFTDDKGKRLDKIRGYLPPAEFAKKLQDVVTVHQELATFKQAFERDPQDIESGSRLAAAYASRGKVSKAKKILKKLEALDPENKQGHLTAIYLAMGEYYLDEQGEPRIAIRWYERAAELGQTPVDVAEARYRMGLAYFDTHSDHAVKSKKFAKKLRSAQKEFDALLAMDDGPTEDRRREAGELLTAISERLAEHEASRKG